MFGCYVDEMMKIYLIACWICWLALAYPFCCMVVMYVAVLSCDDHQLGWWEQMGEVLVVSKGMAIRQLSHLGWSLLLTISLGLRPLYQLMISFSTLLLRIVSVYVGIVVCQVVGVALRTPRLRCYTLSRDVSFNFV